MTDKVLRELYYNPSDEAGFSSVPKLYKAAKLKLPSITLTEVKNWLKGELTYTLHKPARRRFTRNPIIVSNIDEQWQADLVDMQAFSKHNNGFKYILTVIDIFSKYAWALPIKDKSGGAIKDALAGIFSHRKPFRLQTDQGKEFTNSQVQRLLKDHDVHFFTSKNEDIKCAVIERFNRTLKSKMFKYFTAKGTRKYVDVLPELLRAYNNSFHRTIKMKPVEVNTSNEQKVFKNIYNAKSRRELQKSVANSEALPLEETVRTKYKLKPFDKGYYPLWTDEVFKISKRHFKGDKPLYTLRNEKNEIQNRRYYPEEIQVIKPLLYRVEKILDQRRRRGKIEYLIKWLNYSDSYNSWEPAENVINL